LKNILCFGDSLTWGWNAQTMGRFSYDKRWTGILQSKLGVQYRLIEEGLNGRTTVFDDALTPFGQFGVGLNVLPMILDAHRPIDLVIICLGSNDIQFHRNNSIKTAARGCANCIMQILKSTAGPDGGTPKVLLFTPPKFQRPADYMDLAFEEQVLDSAAISQAYTKVAKAFNLAFLDIASDNKDNLAILATAYDGIHLDEAGNSQLADLLYEKVLTMV